MDNQLNMFGEEDNIIVPKPLSLKISKNKKKGDGLNQLKWLFP